MFWVTVIVSTCASGTSVTPASLSVLNCGLRSIVKPLGALTLEMTNGPLDGGGLLVASLSSGVFCGTGAANIRPSRLVKVPLGLSSLMVMSPVVSSVVMPEMVSAFPSAKSVAPMMPS